MTSKKKIGVRTTLLLLFLIIGVGFTIITVSIPSFEDFKSSTKSSESRLLDRHGYILERLRLDPHQRLLEWTPTERISPALIHAIIAAEDQRFYYHPGIDPISLCSALLDNLHRKRPRGASTLSMQLATLIRPGAYQPHTLLGKIQQMRIALALEIHWTKQQILEAYLNRVIFRGELTGVNAASRGLFRKGPGGLNLSDSAILAALIRAPTASRHKIGQRACAILKTLHEPQICSHATFVALGLPKSPYPIPGQDEAPHLARQLLKQPGESIRSTLDASLQYFVIETLHAHLAELSNQNVEDGAVVVLDNKTGDVLAYVGSSGDLSGAAEVDGAMALRQPGSSLKPFLYGIAIDQRWLTAASILDDSPLALTTPSGLYIPQDYDKHFRGAVSVRSALSSSLNVPAVRTLTLIGTDRFLQTLRNFGLHTLTYDADHYGYGLALGGAEINLLSLTNAYRALANQGIWTPIYFTFPHQPHLPPQSEHRVLSPQAAFIIGNILSDPTARALTFGLSSPLSTHTWSAVKTGTSKGMRDNWAMGFTDRYTIGVWVGNFSGASMWDVSGITGAAPIWHDIVEHLHANTPSQPPAPPTNVIAQTIVFEPPVEASRTEWFITPSKNHTLSSSINTPPPPPKIIHVISAQTQLIAPPDAITIAPDPDIPQRLQSILIQASSSQTACLRLDGHPIAQCGILKRLIPLPLPGKHSVELTNRHGTMLDRHRFTVRGLIGHT